MAFNRKDDVTKDSIEDFEIVFFVPGPSNTEGIQSGQLDFQLKFSDGRVVTRSVDLLDRLADDAPGATHLSNLVALRDYIRTRLNNEVLPL